MRDLTEGTLLRNLDKPRQERLLIALDKGFRDDGELAAQVCRDDARLTMLSFSTTRQPMSSRSRL